MQTLSETSGRHFKTLRDAIVFNRKRISPAAHKQLLALNTTHAFLRHYTPAFARDLHRSVRDVAQEEVNCTGQKDVGTAPQPERGYGDVGPPQPLQASSPACASSSSPSSTTISAEDDQAAIPTSFVGDWRSLPPSAWQAIHSRFAPVSKLHNSVADAAATTESADKETLHESPAGNITSAPSSTGGADEEVCGLCDVCWCIRPYGHLGRHLSDMQVRLFGMLPD